MDLVKYLAVSMILFLLGIWGIFLNRKNILVMLMSIELMLLAVNLNFLVFSVYLDDLLGQLFALLILKYLRIFIFQIFKEKSKQKI